MLIGELKNRLVDTARINAWVGNELLNHPELAQAEQEIMIAIAGEVVKRRELSPDDVVNLFTFVFGKSCEAVSLWLNNQPPDTSINGLFSSSIPVYAAEGLLAIFRECELPRTFAGEFLAAELEGDPVLNLMSVLNLIWQLGVHIALASSGRGE